jgi:hypothetical protein
VSFIEGVKKKFFGDESQVQKAPTGDKRIGSMGKAYGGGGGAVKTEHGVGFDASTYKEPDTAPTGRVGSLNEFNPNRMGKPQKDKFAGVKSAGKEVFDYVAPKAKAAGKWMQDRGMELNGDLPKKGRKKVSARVPRRSQPPGYDGSMDMFGGGMGADMFGVGNFGGGFGGGYESEEREEAPRKRRKSRRRPTREERGEGGGFDMNHIPESMRGMF